MKLAAHFAVFCSFWFLFRGEICNPKNSFKRFSKLAEAVKTIVEDVYTKETNTVNIFSKSSSNNFNDFKNELLAQTSRVSFRQESSSRIAEEMNQRKRCNIFVIDSFEDFAEIYKRISSNIFYFNGFFLFVLTNGEIPEIEEIFRLLWKIFIHNAVVVHGKDEISIKTFLPFTSKSCNDVTPIVINQFKDGKLTTGEDLFPDKMKNLHECPIRLSVADNNEPYVFAKLLKNGSYDLGGRDIYVISAMAKKMNFRINYTYIGVEGIFVENVTASGVLKMLLDNEADLSISDWWLNTYRLKFLDGSKPYLISQIILMIPPGREFTTFEKLIYPFSLKLWILILTCSVFGCVVILIIKRHSSVVQNFVFGDDVKYPILNMFIGFIGGTQHLLPKRNFARFLLIMLLIYSLVIRTLYQGSYYQLLQSNKHQKEVQSIDEMISKDFKFYVHDVMAHIFTGTQALKNR